MFCLNLCTDMVNTWLTFIEQAQRNREDAKSFVLEEASLMEVKVRNVINCTLIIQTEFLCMKNKFTNTVKHG